MNGTVLSFFLNVKRYRPRIFFLALFFLIVFAPRLMSQNRLSTIIDEDFRDVPLKVVLQTLSEKYNVPFSYLEQDIPDIVIRETLKSISLEKALTLILSDHAMSFRAETSGKIAIFKDVKKSISKILSDSDLEVSGVILHADSRVPVESARITILDLPLHAVTNRKGFFNIKNIPSGDIRLILKADGFLNDSLSLTVTTTSVMIDTLYLQPDPFFKPSRKETAGIGITSDQTYPGALRLDKKRLLFTPSLAEPDVLHAIRTLPGFSALNDASNHFSVRGGNPDYNALSLDGATLYIPYHLFGQMSVVNTDIVDRIDAYTGGFPSEDGNRLSGYTDIRTKNKNEKAFSGQGAFSLMTIKGTFESQIHDKIYLILSGRRNYLDQMTNVAKKFKSEFDILPAYRFYDVFGKLVYRVNENHEFGLSGFTSDDDFTGKNKKKQFAETVTTGGNPPQDVYLGFSKIEHGYLNWSNKIFRVYWKFSNQKNWTSQVRFHQSQADIDAFNKKYYRYGNSAGSDIQRWVDSVNQLNDPDRIDVANHIIERTVRLSNELIVHDKHTLLFGTEFSALNLKYSWNAPLDKESYFEKNKYAQIFYNNPADTFFHRRTGYLAALYVEDLWRAGRQWTIRPGFRIDHAPGTRQGWFVSPRLNARFDATETFSAKAAAGLYYQALFTSLDHGAVNLFPLPFYAKNLSVPRFLQSMIGSEWMFAKYFKWTADFYYKKFDRLKSNTTSTVSEPEWMSGKGQTIGAMTAFYAAYKAFAFMASYELADSRQTFEGRTFYTSYDRRHAVNLNLSMQMPGNWIIDARWFFASAQAYRPVNYYTQLVNLDPQNGSHGSGGEGYLSYRSTEHLNIYGRLPVYHRLDVSFAKVFRTGSWSFRFFVNVLNAYNRMNPILHEDQLAVGKEGNDKYSYPKKSKIYGMPILPSLGFGFEF